MNPDSEVRAILNTMRAAITDCRVSMLYATKREIEMEKLAQDLDLPVIDLKAWLDFLSGRYQA